jgi:hypothetical protein
VDGTREGKQMISEISVSRISRSWDESGFVLGIAWTYNERREDRPGMSQFLFLLWSFEVRWV